MDVLRWLSCFGATYACLLDLKAAINSVFEWLDPGLLALVALRTWGIVSWVVVVSFIRFQSLPELVLSCHAGEETSSCTLPDQCQIAIHNLLDMVFREISLLHGHSQIKIFGFSTKDNWDACPSSVPWWASFLWSFSRLHLFFHLLTSIGSRFRRFGGFAERVRGVTAVILLLQRAHVELNLNRVALIQVVCMRGLGAAN